MPKILKLAAILLLMYTVIAAFLFPLIPGGLDVEVGTLKPGSNEFTFTGYNTHFLSDSKKAHFYLASDTTYYCPSLITIVDDAHAKITVDLPDTVPSKNWAFYANTDPDGTVYIKKAVDSEGFVFQEGATSPCEVKVDNNEHQGFGFPFQIIIYETIRNLMFHVPMWFTMFALMIASFIFSLRVLMNGGREGKKTEMNYRSLMNEDLRASVSANSGLVFCMLGLITGSFWARFTWGTWWTLDPQLNGSMVVFLVYAAYFILRRETKDEEKRARISAIFNIFAFVLMVVLLMVMPRFAAGLHPGKSGNPAFSKYDLDSSLRMVFYPACAGWILLGFWLYSIHLRIQRLENKKEELNHE